MAASPSSTIFIYVFHPPIVIIDARLMHGLESAPLPEFAMLTGFSVVVTFALSALVFRRVPVLRAIL